jgi:putative tryptophan/tyrosine transport system substrate-binding protein
MGRGTLGCIVTLALSLLAAPLAANGQWARPVPRIGSLLLGDANAPCYQHWLEAFRQGLREHGWVEGQNIAIAYRFAEEHAERLADLATELVRLPVDVLIGAREPVIRALQHATRTLPIVMAISGDPVGSGFVASVARPGGNITGLSIQSVEVSGKRLELLKQAVPQAVRVAVLWSADYRTHVLGWQDTQVAAQALGVTLQAVEVDGPPPLMTPWP